MYQPGQAFNVQYPFVRTTWERHDGDDESGFTASASTVGRRGRLLGPCPCAS